MNVIRTLFTSHTAQLSGSAMSLHTLLTGLDRHQFEPCVLMAAPGSLERQLAEAGIAQDQLAYAGWRKLLAVPRARALLKRRGIQLVYLNCVVGFSRAVGTAARQLGLPVVLHMREPPDSSRVRRHLSSLLKLADRIVVVSEEQREHLVKAGARQVVKIDNGVDLDRFQPAQDAGTAFRMHHGLPLESFVFGVVGTIEPRKNTLQCLQAAEALARPGNGLPPFRLLLVGKGEPRYLAEVQAFVHASPVLSERVHFTGELPDVPAAMAAMDCLVMPSLWEGFPRGLLEAMCCGRPAIASDVGEVRHMLAGGENGLIVPPGDEAALQAAMRRALTEPAMLAAMANRASTDARRRFSQQAHVARMAEVLAAAAASSNL